MMKVILDATELVRYNANARGNSTDDCVARGISLAFNKTYDQVLKDLRSTAKAMHSDSYKITRVIRRLIETYMPGAQQKHPTDFVNKDTGEINKNYPTVGDFVDANPNATIIILCGDKADGRSNHLVTALNGKLYDTWDSRDRFVASYWIIEGMEYDFKLDLNVSKDTLHDKALKDIDFFGTKYCTKYDIPVQEVHLVQTWWSNNVLKLKIEWNSKKTGKDYDFSFNLSYPPTMSLDDALKYTSTTVKTRLYDRFYAAAKKDADEYEAQQMVKELGGTPDQRFLWMDGVERRFYNSLPAKIKPYIEYLDINCPGQYSHSVYVRIKALPGDPRKDDPECNKVRFRWYDAASVKDMIARYLKNWEHPEVDYSPYEEY